MKKNILIIGPQMSGKTRMSNYIIDNLNIDFNKKVKYGCLFFKKIHFENPHLFSDMDIDTKIVVFEDIKKSIFSEIYTYIDCNQLIINPKHLKPFSIYPVVIAVFDEKIKEYDFKLADFKEKFHVINLFEHTFEDYMKDELLNEELNLIIKKTNLSIQ